MLSSVGTQVAIYAIIAVPMTLLAGSTGQVSLGQAAPVAIGAYASALLVMRLNLPFLVALLLAGVIAVGIGLGAGLLLGLLAAARPGRVQGLIMRTADFMLAFPAILTAIMLTAVFGAGLGNAIVAVGIYNIPSFVRITRAAAAGVWSREYAMAARACGLGPWQITWRHVLPNILPLLLVQATVRFAVAILAEAALSFLGFGVQPPQPSWGRMLADAQSVLFEAPLQALWPGLAIMLAVLGLNLLGDGLRDLLDPKLRRR